MGGVSRPALLAAALIVLLGATAASCGDDDPDVALGSASRTTVAEVVDAPAAVTAKSAATLSAPADGTLAEMRVAPGDQVRKGQVLAIIDSPASESRLRQAKQALDAARRAGGGFGGGVNLSGVQRETDKAAAAAFTAARKAAGKITDPAARAALLTHVDSAERQYEVAARAAGQAVRAVQRGVAGLSSAMSALSAAQRLQAQQAYDLAKATVDALTLRAPIPGVVQYGGAASSASAASALGALSALGGAAAPSLGAAAEPQPGVDVAIPVGGQVTAGTAVLTVVDTSALGLVAEVDETDVLLVESGQEATVELDAATGATYTAGVRSVDVLPTASARGGVAYRVRLALGTGEYADGRDAPAPRPGMSAVVHLQVRQADDAVAVPAAAVFSADGRDAVWVVRDGRAERVDVTVGVQGADLVQIVSGVEAGQRVVVRGTDLVTSGQEFP
ncbi:HlyD family efflux transporter periplasmic adaptor subunit [Micromonospora sp. CPCC 205371]|nr:HlyD family efflux transporter periplasmic adaptor subunit [Micromonospora sp. CPCC 205371]